MAGMIGQLIDVRTGAVFDRPRIDELGVPSLEALTYVSDEGPGISRHRKGTGFSYRTAKGEPLRDKDAVARIASLAIPPAWTDVWISPDPDGHILATGRDIKGRKQYRYHPHWSACRDEVKFGSLLSFAKHLDTLRGQVDADLRRRDLTFDRVVASIVWLLDHTMIRVGNIAYARDNKSFGLTTLRNRHVEVQGDRLKFDFRGKSGKQWNIGLTDRRMARLIRTVQDLPGQSLFQYLDDDGKRHPVASHDINTYIRSATGSEFSSKHFRTWGATVRALQLFGAEPLPETKAATARTLNALVDQVAEKLGNTRTVCRSCYIHPQVLTSWAEGTLPAELASIPRRRTSTSRLDPEEKQALDWLALHDKT